MFDPAFGIRKGIVENAQDSITVIKHSIVLPPLALQLVLGPKVIVYKLKNKSLNLGSCFFFNAVAGNHHLPQSRQAAQELPGGNVTSQPSQPSQHERPHPSPQEPRAG
jgi:hypothetical protein